MKSFAATTFLALLFASSAIAAPMCSPRSPHYPHSPLKTSPTHTTLPHTTPSSSTLPSTTVSTTTVASTTVVSTTLSSTIVPSTTVASTTVSSTIVPSTTVASTTVPSTTVASTTVSSTAPSSTDISADAQDYLTAHNNLRAQHGADALVWNATLTAAAQQWANKCVFEHSGGALGPYGENLAAGTGDGFTIPISVAMWTNEASDYNASDPQASHYTQMVWKETTQLGCARANCTGIFDASYGLAHFDVCEYYPQGNVIGWFSQNVQ